VSTKSLASQVTGSLADTKKLDHNYAGLIAIIVLAAAFVIAVLLTLSSITKRVREIGTLRAIGWSKGRVVRQLTGETLAIGLLGGLLGVAIGAALLPLIHPTLKSNSGGIAGLASGSSAGFIGLAQSTAQTTANLTIHAHISMSTLLLGVGFALIGGLIAGLIGSWRAARLAPATALRDIG
jgi:ABC-type antimicrobial peptide transport system permease subunit